MIQWRSPGAKRSGEKIKMNRQRSFGLALALLATLPSAAFALELTTNGGFETGTFAGWTQFESAAGNQTITGVNPSSGAWAAEINNQQDASNSLMKQANIGVGVVTPGMTINIKFDARGSFGVGGVAFAEFFTEKAGGGTSKAEILGGAPLNLDADPNVWKTFSFTTTAGADVSGGVTLQLGATKPAIQGSFAHVFYDNASVTVVPEPATMTALGLGVLALVRRRRARS